jgi:hypothetical protein
MSIRFTLWWKFSLLPFIFVVFGCTTIRDLVLPPQPCKPAVDLPVHKQVAPLPEVDTSNDAFFNLFLHERATHAKDDQDYNSLYDTCVGPPAATGGTNGK